MILPLWGKGGEFKHPDPRGLNANIKKTLYSKYLNCKNWVSNTQKQASFLDVKGTLCPDKLGEGNFFVSQALLTLPTLNLSTFTISSLPISGCSPNQMDVIFTAHIRTSTMSILAGSYITFNELTVNFGNAFSIKEGLFTAPQTGDYSFSFTTHLSSGGKGKIVIEKNGVDQLTFGGPSALYENMAFSWMMSLNSGDKLKLKNMQGSIYLVAISQGHSNSMLLSGRLLRSCAVTFSSYMNSNNIISATGNLYFDKFLLDEGNAFASDVFTAPLNGVFQFNFAANTHPGGEVQIDIEKNNDVILRFSNGNKDNANFGATWLIQLVTNDTIKLKVSKGSIYSNSDLTRILNGQMVPHQTSGAVMFSAYSNSGGTMNGQKIVFDKQVMVNIGGGYDYTTGIFKAPVRGVYEFATTVNSVTGDYGHVMIQKKIHGLWFSIYGLASSSYDYSSVHSNWIMELEKDDSVRLMSHSEYPSYIDAQHNAIFSGLLLKQT